MASYGTVDDIPFLTALEDKNDVMTPTFQEYVEEQKAHVKAQGDTLDDSVDDMEEGSKKGGSMNVSFWVDDPNVLLQNPLELFPIGENLSFVQKMNAITRVVVLLMIIGFVWSRKMSILVISAMTLGAIVVMYYVYTKDERKKSSKRVRFADGTEGFVGNEASILTRDGDETPGERLASDANMDTSQVFAEPSSGNPFNNVLMSDYMAAEQKKPAPPAYTEEVKQTIIEQAKNTISERNPEQPLINNKLFRSLEDDLQFEQSLRPFYSTASTTIPNDQGGFVDFCYGSMVSCKEGNQFACARNLARHQN